MRDIFCRNKSPYSTLFDLKDSFSMTSSLHLRWTLYFFPVIGVFKQLCNKWQSICFLNLRDATGFVGNSYRFVNTAVELLRFGGFFGVFGGFFVLFCFFFFVFSFFSSKKPHPFEWACSYSLIGPGPATDLLSSCERQQRVKRQKNRYDPAIYFDYAADPDGQDGKYWCCEMKDMEYLDHLQLLLNLANRNLELQYL